MGECTHSFFLPSALCDETTAQTPRKPCTGVRGSEEMSVLRAILVWTQLKLTEVQEIASSSATFRFTAHYYARSEFSFVFTAPAMAQGGLPCGLL